jgi:hypothetical protein
MRTFLPTRQTIRLALLLYSPRSKAGTLCVPKKRAPGEARELVIVSNFLTLYFLGSHFFQFSANASTLSFVTGIRSPFTKLEGGFLFSATLS